MINQGKKIKREAKRQVGKIKRIIKPKTKKAGLAPGTLIYIGEKPEQPIKISLIDYSGEYFEEKEVKNIEDVFSLKKTESISWINIDGIHNVELIEKIGKQFDIHSLVLEDIMHTTQRPKLEDYENQIFIVLRMFIYNEDTKEIVNEQVSLILGKNYLLTFQEDIGDVFGPVRERLRKGGPKIRNNGPDYLAYALMDAVVDSYFHILEKIGEDIEEIEDRLVIDPEKEDLHKVHQLRRDLILLRKSVWPLREALSSMQRNETGMVKKSTEIYLRDVYDHTIQVIDTIESYRDMVVGMLDVYLSSLSNKMNEVMKVLTIIATVFIPLTFLAGVYGMNFVHFPELHYEWMYPWGFWIFTVLVIGLMLWYFKRKKWM
jgi:magnesium transporter